MGPFAYRRAADEREAIAIAAAQPGAAFVAGGTDFMQLWKAGVSAPDLVIDISRLPLDAVTLHPDRIAIGALARMSDVANHPAIGRDYRAIADSILASASPQ